MKWPIDWAIPPCMVSIMLLPYQYVLRLHSMTRTINYSETPDVYGWIVMRYSLLIMKHIQFEQIYCVSFLFCSIARATWQLIFSHWRSSPPRSPLLHLPQNRKNCCCFILVVVVVVVSMTAVYTWLLHYYHNATNSRKSYVCGNDIYEIKPSSTNNWNVINWFVFCS